MRISRKLQRHLVQKPKIRPHVIKSLIAFDQEINQHQNINWNAPTRDRKTSETLDLLHFLVQKMNSDNNFLISQSYIIQKFHFNHLSYNFNFSALYQLKMIKVDWNAFKSQHKVKGAVNVNKVL